MAKRRLGWAKWPEDQKKLFKEMYETASWDDILSEFGWSNKHACQEFARKAGLRRKVKRTKGPLD